MSLSEGFHPTARSKVLLLGYQRGIVREDCGLCTVSPVLGGEIQPTYAGPIMPFGGELAQVQGSDGAICLLLWWHCPGWCSPTRRISGGPAQDNYFWECPASLHWPSCWRGCCGRSSPHWGASGGTKYSSDTMWGVNNEGRGFPNSVPWVERSVASLLAGHHCWTGPLVPCELRQRPHSWSSGGRRAQCQRVEECQQVEGARQESASPPRSLEAVLEVAPPPGFKEVMACLQRDPLPVTAFKVPAEPMQLEPAIKPAVATMCANCIVQDKAMGITYMDTVTTFMGCVALRGPHLATWTPGPTIEAVTDLPWRIGW